MKYFTQQWYHDSQKVHIHYSLNVSNEAKDYNEEYFQKLYKEKMDEFRSTYLNWADEDRLKFESADDFAAKWYLQSLSHLNNCLPAEIKEGIADIRIAALGFVTQEVHDKIKAFCENIDRQTQAQLTMYDNYYKSIKESIPKRIRQPLSSQHDAHIKRIGLLNGDYIIETERLHGKRRQDIFTFKNTSVHQDIVKSGRLIWIYNEIYLQDGKYEVHILFLVYSESWNNKQEIPLTDLIIYAEDIEVETLTPESQYYTEFI